MEKGLLKDKLSKGNLGATTILLRVIFFSGDTICLLPSLDRPC